MSSHTRSTPLPSATLQAYYGLTQHQHLGLLGWVQDTSGIKVLIIGNNAEFLMQELKQRLPNWQLEEAPEHLRQTMAQKLQSLPGPCDLPVNPEGTAFQKIVWQALQDIPYGTTRTYSEIANLIQHPKAVRAVASACAANPVAILIPCHRVLRHDGNDSGYRWGLPLKKQLLASESQRA